MAEEKPKYEPKAKRKVRADKYEEKVHFDGTLEQMIKMAGNTKAKSSDKK
jgi:hypothetical protein